MATVGFGGFALLRPIGVGLNRDDIGCGKAEEMDARRFCGILGSDEQTTHQRVAEYVKPLVVGSSGLELMPREEWIAEQTVQALGRMLADTRYTDDERRAITEFLALASEELAGPP